MIDEMIDVIVTLTGVDHTDENDPFPSTKVFRIEFDTEEAAIKWLNSAPKVIDGPYQLVAKNWHPTWPG